MKGFKAFNGDLTCREYQFNEGQEHIFDGEPVLCASGFHFCTDLKDVVKYYHSPTMRVFEIEATGIITDPEKDCSKRACSVLKLVQELSLDQVKESITTPQLAYEWARWIGDTEHMKQYVTDPQWAYWWARWIGDTEHMIQYVTDPTWAYWWVTYINKEDEDHFKNKGILK